MNALVVFAACLLVSGCERKASPHTPTDDSASSNRLPAQISSAPLPPPIVAPLHATVAAGVSHTCALRGEGQLLCWGGNEMGDCGVGTHAWNGRSDDVKREFLHIPKPTRVLGLAQVSSVACGALCCALDKDGSAWCWSYTDGPDPYAIVDRPRQVNYPSAFVRLAVGSHACGITTNHRVLCWGPNQSGQLGQGTTSVTLQNDYEPKEEVQGLDGRVKGIAATRGSTCAVLDDGKVYCWGDNSEGELGMSNETEHSAKPVLVGIPAAKAIVGGWGHLCAITQDEGVWCWGANQELQAGVGKRHALPNKIPLVTNVVQLALGWDSSFSLTAGGEVWFWGRDERSRDARDVPVKTPQRLQLDGPVSEITAGASHACALDLSDQVWCWGWGREMQLGNGKTDDYPGLVKVQFN